MRKFTLLASAAGAALALPWPASAQQLTAGLVDAKGDHFATQVQEGEFYSQIWVQLSDLQLPQDDNGKKQLGKALLEALHLKSSTRSITISLSFTTPLNGNEVKLPDYPLVSYTFDSSKRVTEVQVVNAFGLPPINLPPNTSVKATLVYRYSEGATYNVQGTADAISGVVPGDMLVSTVSSPVFKAVGGLLSTVLSNSESRSIGTSSTMPMTSYSEGTASVASQAATFTLRVPGGATLGKVNLQFFAGPTLTRQFKPVREVASADKDQPFTKDPASLILPMGSGLTSVPYTEIKGLKEFRDMIADRKDGSITNYCAAGSQNLSGHALTRTDRTVLLYSSMIDAGFKTNDNGWFFVCFPQNNDRTSLHQTVGATLTHVTPPPPPSPTPPAPNPTNWPSALKDAMGCWVSGQTGKWCTQQAPNPRATLLAAMAPQVSFGAMDLQSIDLSTLPADRLAERKLPASDLLDLLHGKVDDFKCYSPGLILIADNKTHAYNMLVTMQDGKIVAVSIQRVGDDMLDCKS